jgi:hypothetical protein
MCGENNRASLKLDLFWSHLPEATRKIVLQALTRMLLDTVAGESEVADD